CAAQCPIRSSATRTATASATCATCARAWPIPSSGTATAMGSGMRARRTTAASPSRGAAAAAPVAPGRWRCCWCSGSCGWRGGVAGSRVRVDPSDWEDDMHLRAIGISVTLGIVGIGFGTASCASKPETPPPDESEVPEEDPTPPGFVKVVEYEQKTKELVLAQEKLQ